MTDNQESSSGANSQRNTRALVGVGVLLVMLFVGSGFFHVVSGSDAGLSLCAKESWGMGDTFLDLDDFTGKPVIVVAMKQKAVTIRALVSCELVQLPESWRR